jgi:hypothetical protein
MANTDWSRWVPVLEKMLADLKALNAYLHGEIGREEYCVRVGIAEQVIGNQHKSQLIGSYLPSLNTCLIR